MVDRQRLILGRRPRPLATPRPAPLTLPAPHRNVAVRSADGTRLHASVYGNENRPTIVLAHGITQQQRAWAYQVADLAADYRIVLYDQRGHGRSGRAQLYTVDALGDDLHAVLTACVPAGERAVVGGHSLGGITIMSWAGRYPGEVADRIAAAVLVNTAASEIAKHLLLIGLPRRLHPAFTYVVRERLMAIIRTRARIPVRILALGKAADPTYVDAIIEMMADAPSATLRQLLTDILAMDLTDQLGCLTVPTVVIGGTRDRLLPPVHCDHIASALPSLERRETIAGSGHMSPWEARETVSRLIAESAQTHLAG